MKTSENMNTRVCPYCGYEYREQPAISRADGETAICPDCGTREALATLGIASGEIEKIIAIIHTQYKGE